MLWLILITSFLAVFLLIYALELVWDRRRRIRDQLTNPDPWQSSALLKPDPERSAVKEMALKWLSASGYWTLKDPKNLSRMRETLIQAGFRHPQAPFIYMSLRALTALWLPVPYLLLLVIKGGVTPLTLLPAVGLSLVGFLLPTLVLRFYKEGRQNRLDRALPDILDLLVICMEAGLSLNASLNRVAEEIKLVYRDFYVELQITSAELRAGLPWDEALDNLGRRTGVQSIKSLVALMIQSEKLGASIGQALRNHGEFTRTQRALRAEERAAKLAVKIVFPLVFFILPVMFIITVGPAIIHIIRTMFPAILGK
ncbi:MAG: type II secretion system F family protein [Deltaproteobacteria bacterium]|nr:type II secretion system F family protein [Deltaproteobacteria bacterium]